MGISSTSVVHGPMDVDILLRILRDAVRDYVADADRVAVAYSGGLDSALVERLAREMARTVCYTSAVPGSHDHRRAPVCAAEEGADVRMITLDGPSVRALVSEASAAIGSTDPMRVAYSIPIVSVIGSAEERVVLTGSGADELFGGYAKYLSDDDPSASMTRDTKKMQLENGLLQRYAESRGRRLAAPFALPEVVAHAGTLPAGRKLRGAERKVILREAAMSLGVLSHDSPKKAAQYSSGVLKEMRRMAKAEGRDLREWTEAVAAEGHRIP